MSVSPCNQARVAEKSTVVSTSTRNFPNRLGKGANVYLAGAYTRPHSAQFEPFLTQKTPCTRPRTP
jgi:aconitase B